MSVPVQGTGKDSTQEGPSDAYRLLVHARVYNLAHEQVNWKCLLAVWSFLFIFGFDYENVPV